MIKLYDSGVFLLNNKDIFTDQNELSQKYKKNITAAEAACGTISYNILKSHNSSADMKSLNIKFDSMTSHDITYVGIIQTARASGMKKFPLPYVLTNCHNSLCAVGGTINEDDHMFALSAAHKYGGIYVPTNMAVIHSYNREMMSGCGRMILGSDSHTRYGALGTLAIGEGGGELAKQLLGRTYDISMPKVIAVYLDGKPNEGVGPQDVALSIIGAVYKNGYVKNSIMEFVGPGVASLPVEYRNGIDVMTTETTCLSSVWATDSRVSDYFAIHNRPDAFKALSPSEIAYYDGCVYVDLSTVECSIALPMHPSNTYTIRELYENAADILRETEKKANEQLNGVKLDMLSKLRSDGGIYAQQGLVAGCSGGTFDNLCAVTDILRSKSCGNGEFTMSVYPGSMPAYIALAKNGAIADMAAAGVIIRECFCGPCFGAGDTPANGELSIRHTTRNFPNREGSKPGEGQMSGVALMDARSIAASAINGGKITAATDIDVKYNVPKYYFDASVYDKRIFDGCGCANEEYSLKFGPNIKDWPELPRLSEDILLKLVCHITDPVTTTDELIPSGETSSYRSNPLRLAEFTLSRKDPDYVPRAKAVKAEELARENGEPLSAEIEKVYAALSKQVKTDAAKTVIASTIFAIKPGDGSAREQAASCQRVLGAGANIACEYATKRYRSNCINWGMLPFITASPEAFANGDYVFIPNVRKKLMNKSDSFEAYILKPDMSIQSTELSLGALTDSEREIIAEGCLINYYRKHK